MAKIVHMSELEPREVADGFEAMQVGQNDFMSIQHFHFEPGGSVPEHAHPHQQIGFVYNGTLTFYENGEEHVVRPGDTYIVDSHEPHYGINETDSPVDGVDIFSPPRGEADWMD
jgi:quercetin dioxygenase-like cupin family protein